MCNFCWQDAYEYAVDTFENRPHRFVILMMEKSLLSSSMVWHIYSADQKHKKALCEAYANKVAAHSYD